MEFARRVGPGRVERGKVVALEWREGDPAAARHP